MQILVAREGRENGLSGEIENGGEEERRRMERERTWMLEEGRMADGMKERGRKVREGLRERRMKGSDVGRERSREGRVRGENGGQ